MDVVPQIKCPRCKASLRSEPRVFRSDYRCAQCGAKIFVRGGYSRALLLLSISIAFGIPWRAGFLHDLVGRIGPLEGFLTFLLGCSIVAMLIFFAMVFTIPYLLAPGVALHEERPYTTLDLR